MPVGRLAPRLAERQQAGTDQPQSKRQKRGEEEKSPSAPAPAAAAPPDPAPLTPSRMSCASTGGKGTPPRGAPSLRLWSPAAARVASPAAGTPVEVKAEEAVAEEQAKDEPEQAKDDPVIRVGDAYQAHVPRLQPPMDDGPSAACEGELLHVGALFDGTAPTLSSSRGRRDVARAPTPGSKHRRAGSVGSSANGAEGAAATSRLDDVDGAGSAPPALPGFQGFAFPLPPMPRGEPSASQERALGWQLVKLGWSPKRQVPPELLDSPRREWSAAERKAFAKALSTQGKHFREMLPLLPGRSLDELVERYYATKAHKRMAQVDSEQATRNVRVGPCGTMGCLLHDNHAGPHKFSAPTGPRIRKPKIKGEDE